MNENDLRDLMRGMAHPEPPLRFTAEDVMAGGRRRARRRTATAGLVAVGAVAAISLPISIAAAGDDSGHTGGGPTAPVSTPPMPTPRATHIPRTPMPAPPAVTMSPAPKESPTLSPLHPAPPTLMPTPGTTLAPPLATVSPAPKDSTTLSPPPTRMPSPPAVTMSPAPKDSPTTSPAPPTLMPTPRPKLAPSTAPVPSPPMVGSK